jgi:hypothetical protein
MAARMVATAVMLLTASMLAGCSREPDNTGGPGLPSQRETEAYPGQRRDLAGRFVVGDTGCFLLRGEGGLRVVVWPTDATHGGAEAILGDGTRVADGDRLEGTGTVMPARFLADWPDGYWGTTVRFCDPDASEVVVFDSVAVAQ